MSRPIDVFISYKAEDRRRIQPLVQALQQEGYLVWWDQHIGTGDDWRQTIEQQLDAARCIIVTWSNRSVGPEGQFVRDEASRAQRRHVYVPILIDSVEPPLGFGESQATSLRGWRGNRSDARYQSVLSAVQRITGARAEKEPQEEPHATVSRRTLVAGGAAAAVVAGAGGWVLLKPRPPGFSDSIAVLPFANLSGDPAQGYFSDGMAEELRSALSRIPGLKVVARTSSEKLRNEDIETAARKLSVGHVLTGSVRRSQALIRVSAQLVDGQDGIERWSEAYDRPAGDALAIQSDIARNVAQALNLQLGRAQWTALSEGGTDDPAAQDLYLKANAVWVSNSTPESLKEVVRLLDAAIRIDPDFAEAYAKKGRAIRAATTQYPSSAADFSRGFAEAEAAAREALRRAPGLTSAYITLASIRVAQLDFKDANTYFARGKVSVSQDVVPLMIYGGFLGAIGNRAEALELASRATAIDPLNPLPVETKLWILLAGRQYADVVRVGRDLLQWAPRRPIASYLVGAALLLLGKTDEARSVFNQAPTDSNYRVIGEGLLAARIGDRGGVNRAIARLRNTAGDAFSFQYAQIYCQRSENELAFKALDRAMEVRDPGLVSLPTDPFLDPLRRDPRYSVLVKKLNFPA